MRFLLALVMLAVEPPTAVQMQNVDFYIDRNIPLRIHRLSGTMRSKDGGAVNFDDKRSFIISIASADVGLTGPDLSLLLNKYVFGYKGSPLSNLRISISGNEIIQKGTIHKVAALPFEIHAALSVTPDGRIMMHPTRTEIIGLHVDKLMKGLGLPLEKIINLSKAKGATVKGNDIYLNPTAILPPPEIEGRVTGVRIQANEIVMTFGSGLATQLRPVPDPAATNYMYYNGGTLRFGKLMQIGADMLITELDPQDPFRFDLDRYKPQLVAGYSRTLESGGLEVWMRDIDKLGSAKLQVSSQRLH
ncbi:MAG TPA: hypothetical protein VFD22_06175 [Gemmatimonadaceae bacterium]|nr:hypothetical protein [Gemmatimonadaceae bacterium]